MAVDREWTDLARMNTQSAQIVVVGGGIYGAATAWELARRGREVALLEGSTFASGASGGAGQRGVRANGRDLRELPLMRQAYTRWPHLEAELDAPTGYQRCGQLLLYERHHDIPAAQVRAAVQTGLGIPTSHLDAQAVHALEPGLAEGILGALHCPLDGVADHTATTLAYTWAAQREGAAAIEGARVTDVVLEGSRARAVQLEDGGRIEVGETLLLLANAGVAPLLEAVWGLVLPVWTVLPQAVFTEPVSPPPFRHLIGHAHRPLALKMTPAGEVMMSGGWRGRWNPERGAGETTPETVAGNVAQAVAVFPSLGGVRVASAWADRPETICIDGIPVIDRTPGTENVLFATGWTGHGWAIAPAVAPLLAEWAVSGTTPRALESFGLDRFEIG
ncbi:MAG: FAD-binding oxidoreductase [Gemmatimonadota bacterium]